MRASPLRREGYNERRGLAHQARHRAARGLDLLFGVHYLLFGDFCHLVLFTLHDIALPPVEVLIVTNLFSLALRRNPLDPSAGVELPE